MSIFTPGHCDGHFMKTDFTNVSRDISYGILFLIGHNTVTSSWSASHLPIELSWRKIITDYRSLSNFPFEYVYHRKHCNSHFFVQATETKIVLARRFN